MMAVTDMLKRNPAALARKAHDDATRALANAQARRDRAANDLAAAQEAQTEAATTEADDAHSTLEASTRRVREARDMLAALDDRIIPAAVSALALAEAAMKDTEREAAYRAAEARRKSAAARLVKEYPDLAAAYGQLLIAVQEADAAVEAANADLPEGREPLLTVEQLTRDIAAQPRRVISDQVENIWHHQSGDRVNNQTWVKDGHYSPPRHGGVQYLGTDRCRQIPKRVVVSIPPIQGQQGPRLADTVLPPLRLPDAPQPEAETEYRQVDAADSEAA
jgi:hypothetical protein